MNVSMPVLLINASYEPLRIIHGKDAIRMMVTGKVEVEVGRDVDVVPGFRMPSVVRLRRYVRVPITTKVMSKRSIHQRDDHRCMYCNTRCNGSGDEPNAISLDHVIPRSRGGRNDWDNLVTACKRCNHRKADRTPEEAGMQLRCRPLPRTIHTSRFVLRQLGSGVAEWDRFLFNDSTGETKLTRHG